MFKRFKVSILDRIHNDFMCSHNYIFLGKEELKELLENGWSGELLNGCEIVEVNKESFYFIGK